MAMPSCMRRWSAGSVSAAEQSGQSSLESRPSGLRGIAEGMEKRRTPGDRAPDSASHPCRSQRNEKSRGKTGSEGRSSKPGMAVCAAALGQEFTRKTTAKRTCKGDGRIGLGSFILPSHSEEQALIQSRKAALLASEKMGDVERVCAIGKLGGR